MNILILNWRDIKNYSGGGAEILTHEIAKRWVSWGHNVTQFSSIFPGGLEEEVVDGVCIIRKGHPDARYLFSSVHFLAFWHYQKRFQNKFDVVIDEIHGIPFFTPWYVKEKKIALICEVAGDLWRQTFGPIFGLLGLLTEKFYLRLVYRYTSYLTISPSTQKDLLENGVRRECITILPMGVSVPARASSLRNSPKEKELTVIFVGRLTASKGIEDTIHAFKEINKKKSKSKLWVIGRGDARYVEQLKKLCKKLNISHKVTFFDFVTEKEKFILLRKAHILIHPSLREGFGLTVPEAGFVGTPVVAYNSPGIRDIVINNKNGILLKKNSPKAIADNVLAIFNDKNLYQKLCKGALLEARQYNWDNTAKTALAILKKL